MSHPCFFLSKRRSTIFHLPVIIPMALHPPVEAQPITRLLDMARNHEPRQQEKTPCSSVVGSRVLFADARGWGGAIGALGWLPVI